MVKAKRKPVSTADVAVEPLPHVSWLRFIGLGIIPKLLENTREIKSLVKDVSDETQAMSITVDKSHDVLKHFATRMMNKAAVAAVVAAAKKKSRPCKTVQRGRRK